MQLEVAGQQVSPISMRLTVLRLRGDAHNAAELYQHSVTWEAYHGAASNILHHWIVAASRLTGGYGFYGNR